jgi:hypothetical protein
MMRGRSPDNAQIQSKRQCYRLYITRWTAAVLADISPDGSGDIGGSYGHGVLNAVIASLSFKSRRLVCVCLVHMTGSECIHLGFAAAVFECDDGSVAVLSELHAAVFHCLEACSNCWAIKLACV